MRRQPALLAVLTLIVSIPVRAQSTDPLPALPDSRADPAAGAGEMAPMRTGDKSVQATPPPTQPPANVLKDVGFGLRLGNMRSALGNVVHIDVAFPLDADPSISKVQFIIQAEKSF